MATQTQELAWDAEYKKPLILSPSNKPQSDVVRFKDWLKKKGRKEDNRIDFTELTVLDLGSGTGRNSFYFADLGAIVTGYEISETALKVAEKYAKHRELPITYEKRSIGSKFGFADSSVDLVLDATSSNSLNREGREVYVRECARVLKPGGMLFVRALCKDGDKNAKVLVERYPGPEPDTYIHPDIGVVETVFTKENFLKTYSEYFDVAFLDKTSHYPAIAGTKYKRNYWIAYFVKK